MRVRVLGAAIGAAIVVSSGSVPSSSAAVLKSSPTIKELTAKDGRIVSTERDATGTVTKRYASGAVLVTSPMRYVSRVGQAAPNGASVGPCGTSFVYLSNGDIDGSGKLVTGRGYHYSTGFYDVDIKHYDPAVDFTWHVRVTGPNWNKLDYDNGHPIYSYSWSGYNHWHTGSPGTYQAQVVATAVAYLASGGACYSQGPISNAIIY